MTINLQQFKMDDHIYFAFLRMIVALILHSESCISDVHAGFQERAVHTQDQLLSITFLIQVT